MRSGGWRQGQITPNATMSRLEMPSATVVVANVTTVCNLLPISPQ